MKVEAGNNRSSEFTQTPLVGLEPTVGSSSQQQIDSSQKVTPNGLSGSTESLSTNGYLSEGNSLLNPRLGKRDLTDEELRGAYDNLSPAEQRYHEDQNGNPSVQFVRKSARGFLRLNLPLSEVNEEIERRAQLRKAEQSHPETPPLSKNEKAKLRRRQDTAKYYRDIREKAARWGERA